MKSLAAVCAVMVQAGRVCPVPTNCELGKFCYALAKQYTASRQLRCHTETGTSLHGEQRHDLQATQQRLVSHPQVRSGVCTGTEQQGQVANSLSYTVDLVACAPDASGRPLPLVPQPLHVQLSLHGGEGALVPGSRSAALKFLVPVGEHCELQGVHGWGSVCTPGPAGSIQQRCGNKQHDQVGCRGWTAGRSRAELPAAVATLSCKRLRCCRPCLSLCCRLAGPGLPGWRCAAVLLQFCCSNQDHCFAAATGPKPAQMVLMQHRYGKRSQTSSAGTLL